MKRHAKKLQGKAKRNQVELTRGGWIVKSSTSGKEYRVFPIRGGDLRCTCDWSKYHPDRPCSHTLAITKDVAGQDNRVAYFWGSEEDARRQHKKMLQLSDGLWVTFS